MRTLLLLLAAAPFLSAETATLRLGDDAGELRPLLANPTDAPVEWRLEGGKARDVRLAEVSDDHDDVVEREGAAVQGTLPAYAVQLVTFRRE